MTADDQKAIKEIRQALDSTSEIAGVFDEVRVEAYVHRMLSLHRGTDVAIGRGATKLYGDLAALVASAIVNVRVTSRANDNELVEAALVERIQEHAKTHYLNPVPGGVAHCTASPDDADDLMDAECLKLQALSRRPWQELPAPGSEKGVNFAFSSGYVCIRCKFCAAFEANQRVQKRTLEKLRQSSELAATPAAAANATLNYEQYRDEFLAQERAKRGQRK